MSLLRREEGRKRRSTAFEVEQNSIMCGAPRHLKAKPNKLSVGAKCTSGSQKGFMHYSKIKEHITCQKRKNNKLPAGGGLSAAETGLSVAFSVYVCVCFQRQLRLMRLSSLVVSWCHGNNIIV